MRFFQVFIIFIISLNTMAGLSSWWMKASGYDCVENGVRLSRSLMGSDESLVNCYGLNSISENELGEFKKSIKRPRVELETWVYIQNSSQKYIFNANKSLKSFNDLNKELKRRDGDQYKSLKENYIILESLKDQLSQLEDDRATCSNLRFWNYPERLISTDLDCSKIKSDSTKSLIEKTKVAIENIEVNNPLLLHHHFDEQFNQSKDERLPFDKLLEKTINSSVFELRAKLVKHHEITNLSLSKENIDLVLSNPDTLSEYIAVDYRPLSKVVMESGQVKGVDLSTAKCRVSQKFLAHKGDRILKSFGTDVAILTGSLFVPIIGGIYFSGAKAVGLASRATKLRGAIIASEAVSSFADINNLSTSKNNCEKLQDHAASMTSISDSLYKELSECHELSRDLAFSYAVSILGASSVAKLSKMDLNQIRLDRIAKRGKDSLHQMSASVKAAVIRNSDIIIEQLEMLSERFNDLSPAMAGLSPSRMDNNLQFSKSHSGNNSHHATRSVASSDNKSLIAKRVDSLIDDLPCVKDKSCKNEMIYLKPGFSKLSELLGSTDLSAKLLKHFNPYPSQSNKALIKILEDCLKVKKGVMKCSPKQLEVVSNLLDFDWKGISPHPHFFDQVIRSTSFNVSPQRMGEITQFFSHQIGQRSGVVRGTSPKVTQQGTTIMLDGQVMHTREGIVKALSLKREKYAVKLLQKLGFDVDILPEGVEARRAQGIQDKFNKLSSAEDLGRSRNPDLILNGNQIADIYSPLGAVNIENAKTIALGVLSKTEGKNFSRVYKRVENIVDDTANGVTEALKKEKEVRVYGKRQTNRVVIYANTISGDLSSTIQAIKKEIAHHRPQHIHEAVIVFESPSGAQMLNVWP